MTDTMMYFPATEKPRGWVNLGRGDTKMLDRLRYRLITLLAGSDAVLVNVHGDGGDEHRASVSLRGNQKCAVLGHSRDLSLRLDDDKPVWWLGPSHD